MRKLNIKYWTLQVLFVGISMASFGQVNWFSLAMDAQKTMTVVANDDYLLIGEGREEEVNVLNNDYGLLGGVKELTVIQKPEHAEIKVLDDFKIWYKAEIGYEGTDEFRYKVCGKNGECDEATVDVNIENIDFIPEAYPDSAKMLRGQEFVIPVLDNDEFLFDGTMEIYILRDINNGVSEIGVDNNIQAYFDEYFRGVDSLQYQVCDENGDCSEAWVFFRVESLVENDIFIPQGISPNGDGLNDVFSIPDLEGLTMQIRIFNPLGELVYLNTEYKNDWDGMGNEGGSTGKICANGTYYYVLKVPAYKKDFSGFIYINK